jgi:hypothetical protein
MEVYAKDAYVGDFESERLAGNPLCEQTVQQRFSHWYLKAVDTTQPAYLDLRKAALLTYAVF